MPEFHTSPYHFSIDMAIHFSSSRGPLPLSCQSNYEVTLGKDTLTIILKLCEITKENRLIKLLMNISRSFLNKKLTLPVPSRY